MLKTKSVDTQQNTTKCRGYSKPRHIAEGFRRMEQKTACPSVTGSAGPLFYGNFFKRMDHFLPVENGETAFCPVSVQRALQSGRMGIIF